MKRLQLGSELYFGLILVLVLFSSCTHRGRSKTREADAAQQNHDARHSEGMSENGCGDKTASACYQEGLKSSGPLNSVDERRRALGLLRDACGRRFARACNRAGIILGMDEVLRNQRLALEYWGKACELDDIGSCWLAGNLLQKPVSADGGLSKNCRRAAEFYQFGCSRGDWGGCSSLGELYASGCDDFPRDAVRARKYSRLGRKLGRDEAP